uniref:Integrase catalytic domain-containing protein n=1 Tax=Strigamia maritima TaxID=126957 RepID=T1JAI5_STRMM
MDNGPQFRSVEIQQFMSRNLIMQKFSPFHTIPPAVKRKSRAGSAVVEGTAGKDDRTVGGRVLTKNTIDPARHTIKSRWSVPSFSAYGERDNRCVVQYARMWTRSRSLDAMGTWDQLDATLKHFDVDQTVWARNYTGKGHLWIPATVRARLGRVLEDEQDHHLIRHLNQIRQRSLSASHTPITVVKSLPQLPSTEHTTRRGHIIFGTPPVQGSHGQVQTLATPVVPMVGQRPAGTIPPTAALLASTGLTPLPVSPPSPISSSGSTPPGSPYVP